MQQGSGRPAGGDVSCREPAASSKPAATAAGAPRWVALLGACGWQDRREELPHPGLGSGARTQPGGEVGTVEERGDAGSWLTLTHT